MELKRIDHIGVVVADLEEAGALLEKGFGLPVRPGANRADMRTLFYQCGDVSIELIEVTDPESRRERLGEGQRARIEHIAVEVGGLEETLSALAALGVTPNAPPRNGVNGPTFFTNPESSMGIMFQFIQKLK